MNTGISIIIPCLIKDAKLFKMTKNLLDGLTTTVGISYCETILINDGGNPKYTDTLGRLYPDIDVINNPTNLGYAKSCNVGIKASNGAKVLLLNNDVEIYNPNWLKALNNEPYDITGVRYCYLDKEYRYIPLYDVKTPKTYRYIDGWCMLIKKPVIEALGGLDESFGVGYYEDVSLCRKAEKAGYTIGIADISNMIKHLSHKTFLAEGYNLAKEVENKRLIFKSKEE